MNLIDDVAMQVMEKLAARQGSVRNAISKLPDVKVYSHIPKANLNAYMQDESPALKSFVELSMEGKPIATETSSRNASDNFGRARAAAGLYEDYKFQGRSDTLDGNKLKGLSNRYSGPVKEIDHNNLLSQLDKVPDAPTPLGSPANIYLTNGKPNWIYGPVGIVPTSIDRGELLGVNPNKKGVGPGNEAVIRPEISEGGSEIVLPKATGIEYYDPKKLVFNDDGTINNRGVEIARQLKARGALAINNKYLRKILSTQVIN